MTQKKALVVDDSKLARYVMKKMLMEYSLSVDTVESAEEALGYLSHQECDIVFMDQMMPGMDGLEAVKAIKEDPRTANIPVMMYTSKGGEVFVAQARELGAYGVMSKQIKPVELYKVLSQLQLISHQHSGNAEDLPAAKATAPHFDEQQASRPLTEEEMQNVVRPDQDSIEAIAQVASESVEQHSFPAQVRKLLNEQTQLLRREFSRHTRKIIDSRQPKQEGGSQLFSDRAQLAQDALKMGLSALIIVLPALLILLWHSNNSDSDGIIQNLRLEQQELVKRQEALSATIETKEKNQQLLVESLEWAVNISGFFGFEDLIIDTEKTQMIFELYSRLKAVGFKGQINIDGYIGDFCVINDEEKGIIVAGAQVAMKDCKTLRQLGDAGAAYVERQSFAYKELMSLPFLNDSEDIQTSGTFHGLNSPMVKYPSIAIVDRAGEWNAIATKNSRIVLSFIPESDWLQSH